MRARHFTPLLGFALPSLVIGFGVVIPGSCIAGVNQLSVGFATTVLGACATYWVGIRMALADSASAPSPAGRDPMPEGSPSNRTQAPS